MSAFLFTMNTPRIYISATHKSSGKTTLSIGLCHALTRLGWKVQPFKKGPDYIDPLWLGAASKRTCYNLDFNTMSHDEILYKLSDYSVGNTRRQTDMVLIEGNLGLYDGVELDGSTSNAAMAKLTKTPVILVLDAEGVTRGVAPVVLGYQSFDKDIDIVGIIFNKVRDQRHQTKLINVIEHYTDVPVVGSVFRSSDMTLVERHLGLMPYNESHRAVEKISLIASRVAEQVDLDRVMSLSKIATKIPENKFASPKIHKPLSDLKIGVCRDEAFGFYYPDDLKSLVRAGASLVMINTLKDQQLPSDLDGLFIGGGFPETQMERLSSNASMRSSIYQAIENNLPVYAECGGLMYLSQSIRWNNEQYPMVGIIPANTQMNDVPQGRGYVKLVENKTMPWPSSNTPDIISAHEFHYSKLDDEQGELAKKGAFAYSVERGFGIDGKHDGWLYKNLLASYSHMRDSGKYRWAERFVTYIRNIKESKK